MKHIQIGISSLNNIDNRLADADHFIIYTTFKRDRAKEAEIYKLVLALQIK